MCEGTGEREESDATCAFSSLVAVCARVSLIFSFSITPMFLAISPLWSLFRVISRFAGIYQHSGDCGVGNWGNRGILVGNWELGTGQLGRCPRRTARWSRTSAERPPNAGVFFMFRLCLVFWKCSRLCLAALAQALCALLRALLAAVFVWCGVLHVVYVAV